METQPCEVTILSAWEESAILFDHNVTEESPTGYFQVKRLGTRNGEVLRKRELVKLLREFKNGPGLLAGSQAVVAMGRTRQTAVSLARLRPEGWGTGWCANTLGAQQLKQRAE